MSEEDRNLCEELEEFGEMVSKVTDKNRPLLVKKLNHLRARRRMSEKLSQSMLKESLPKQQAASRRGRAKKGKQAKSGSSRQVVLDDEVDDDERDQRNDTFSITDVTTDAEAPAKRKAAASTGDAIVPSVGPYAVMGRKSAVGKSRQNAQSSVKPHKEPGQNGSTSMTENVSASSYQLSYFPAVQYVPKRGRTRMLGDLKADADEESESSVGNTAQKVPPALNRRGRASAIPAAATLREEEDVTESISVGVSSSSMNAVPGREESHYSASTSKAQKRRLETSESSEDIGKDARKQSALSRIPKLARFPTPPQVIDSCDIFQVAVQFVHITCGNLKTV